jgi:hypothetical protein
MNSFQQKYLSTVIIAGCSTLALMTACHYNLLLDRLKTETQISTNLNTLLTQQDLNSVNLRLEHDKINKQVLLLKKIINDKRIRIDEMNSLVRTCNETYHDKQQIMTLCNKMEQYLAVKCKEKGINLLPQRHINNEIETSRSLISSNQVSVARMITLYEQKT